jgi:hypothetical protein
MCTSANFGGNLVSEFPERIALRQSEALGISTLSRKKTKSSEADENSVLEDIHFLLVSGGDFHRYRRPPLGETGSPARDASASSR